jgi:hypothetical protein
MHWKVCRSSAGNFPRLWKACRSAAGRKPIVWKVMWETLSKQFSTDPNNTIKESWESYIPPYRNLGAIFIKAYNKKMESM